LGFPLVGKLSAEQTDEGGSNLDEKFHLIRCCITLFCEGE